MTDYSDEADRVLAETTEPPLSLEEYANLVVENPEYASQSSKYLLEAIKSYGTRTVVERGEEKERWVFFDDPYGNGEHAVLGNTDILNRFVDDLRQMASAEGENDKIAWFGGPTATGKSELKRCLVNGLRGYSRTEDGKRYTMEWNVTTTSTDGNRSMTYGGESPGQEDEWYPSPVNENPLTVFPPEVREQIFDEMNTGEEFPIETNERMDPFCAEAYNLLESHYKTRDSDALFSHITSKKHLRVTRQHVDVGDGIGILHSEDDGSPKERLVGSWMAGMLRELNSRGRKNPQAFSYDGVFAQGNGLLTLVEDASQHTDLLQKLLNAPEEGMVKLDKQISMCIDTVMVILSNPDLEAKLNQHADKVRKDPLKALRRRLDKYPFHYLTNLSEETALLHRELLNTNTLWTDTDVQTREERIVQPLEMYGCEFAPHAIEAAALYSIVTRLDIDALPSELSLIDKALLFDRGYHEDDNEKKSINDFEFPDNAPDNLEFPEDSYDGESGIPVTYTEDILADLAQHNDLVMPHEVLDHMRDGLEDHPLFGSEEVGPFSDRVDEVFERIADQQEADVISAILHDVSVSNDAIENYVESVYAWDADDDGSDAEEEYDPLQMKVFEVTHLGREETEYNGTEPSVSVTKFRRDKIIQPFNKHVWDSRGDGFQVENLPLQDAPVLKSLLDDENWDEVFQRFENLDVSQWREPPADTETENVHDNTIDNLIEIYGYSQESARKTSVRVMDNLLENQSKVSPDYRHRLENTD